jgi:hypothetical protein
MKTKIILDIPKGKSIKDCHLRKIEVLDENGNTIKTITEGIKPLKIKH